MNLKDRAFQWFSLGLNCIPTKNKKPLVESWKRWMTERQTLAEFELLNWELADTFAVICGTKTEHGYLGCIDIDHPSELPEFKVENFQRQTLVEKTPRGGYHIYFWSKLPVKGTKYQNFELLGAKNFCCIYGAATSPIFTLRDLQSEFEGQALLLGLKAIIPENLTIEELLELHLPKDTLRNKVAHVLASKLRSLDKSKDEVSSILVQWNTKNVEPLTNTELLRTVESAFAPPTPYYNKKKKQEIKEILQAQATIVTNEFLAEEIWNRKDSPQFYIKYFDDRPDETKTVIDLGQMTPEGIPIKLVPIDNGALRNKLVLIPEKPTPITLSELLLKAEAFVAKVYDACGKDSYVKLLCYIAIASWFLDRFIEDSKYDVAGSGKYAPIIVIRGMPQSGKNRLAFALRMLSYRSFYEIGTVRIPSLFRPMHQWGGTLILDEADFLLTGETSELIHYLNSRCYGTAISRQNPVDPAKSQEFKNFGLTILTQRHAFDDPATESRCIPFLSERSTKQLPTVETEEMLKEGLELQNMLLYLRLENFNKFKIDKTAWIKDTVDSRFVSSILPLLPLAKIEPKILENIEANLKEVERNKLIEKSNSLIGLVVASLWEKTVYGKYAGALNSYYFEKKVYGEPTNGFIEAGEDNDYSLAPLTISDLAEELKLSQRVIAKTIISLRLGSSELPKFIKVNEKMYRPIFFTPDKLEKIIREYIVDYVPFSLFEKLGIPRPEGESNEK